MRRAFVITVATLAGCSSSEPSARGVDGDAAPGAQVPVPITETECHPCLASWSRCCRDDLEGRACDTDQTCLVPPKDGIGVGMPEFDEMRCTKGLWTRGPSVACNPPGWGSAPDAGDTDAGGDAGATDAADEG